MNPKNKHADTSAPVLPSVLWFLREKKKGNGENKNKRNGKERSSEGRARHQNIEERIDPFQAGDFNAR